MASQEKTTHLTKSQVLDADWHVDALQVLGNGILQERACATTLCISESLCCLASTSCCPATGTIIKLARQLSDIECRITQHVASSRTEHKHPYKRALMLASCFLKCSGNLAPAAASQQKEGLCTMLKFCPTSSCTCDGGVPSLAGTLS